MYILPPVNGILNMSGFSVEGCLLLTDLGPIVTSQVICAT